MAVKRCPLILDLKPFRSVKGKHFVDREFQSRCVRKETVDILVTSRNGDRKFMQSIRMVSRPPSQ